MEMLKLLPAPIRRLLLPAPRKPRPTIKRVEVRVPVGFKLRLGGEVTQAFNLSVEAGFRWHPDWDEPRATVNAYQFLPMGDALCWSGTDVQDFADLLPKEFEALAIYHGLSNSKDSAAALAALERLGLDIPAERQPIATFIAVPPLRRLN